MREHRLLPGIPSVGYPCGGPIFALRPIAKSFSASAAVLRQLYATAIVCGKIFTRAHEFGAVEFTAVKSI